EEKSRTRLEHEISCLSVHPLQQQPQQQQSEQSELREAGGEDGMKVEGNAETAAAPSSASLVAVGMWTDMSVRLLSLPTLEGRHRCELGGDTQARSVLLTTFQDDHHYLLVGLGDGQLASYPLAFTGDQLSLGPRKKVSLGTQPLSLTPFSSHSSSSPSLCVFASSDRPTVIYSSNGEKLLFSNVNTPEVTLMAPFHSPLFPDCLALASEGGLRIGTVDDIQKLQVQTVPLGT
ncbi:dna damage-binding protein 1-like, partial [Nannochloropsis oceanica]